MDSSKHVVTQTAQELGRYKTVQKDRNVRERFAKREEGHTKVGGGF